MRWALVLSLVAAVARPAHAKGCHEHSGVVGYQHCDHFGTWSPDDPILLLWVDAGELTERFDTHASRLVDGSLVHGGLTHATAAAFAFRILGGWRVAPRLTLYTGGELAVGALVDRPDELVGGLDRSSEFLAAHAIAGARTIVGRVGLSAELAAGGRYDGVIACADTACMHGAYATGGRGELDARVRGDYWLTPWSSIGLMIGQSCVDADDRELLAVVTLHARAYDGL